VKNVSASVMVNYVLDVLPRVMTPSTHAALRKKVKAH
jgi:hypothetical protein